MIVLTIFLVLLALICINVPIGVALAGLTIGEAQHAIADGLIQQSDVYELGAVINGTHPGRTSDGEITLFDGTGVGLQDLAVASSIVDLAVEKGIATIVDF